MSRIKIHIFALILMMSICENNLWAQNNVVLQGIVFRDGFGDILADIPVDLLLDGKVILRTKSDAEGKYIFKGLNSNTYQLEAQLGGFRKKTLTVKLEKNQVYKINVGLKLVHLEDIDYIGPDGKESDYPTWKVMHGGVIKQTDGKPISDATVTLISLHSEKAPRECQSNKDGEYNFEINNEGQFLIYVTKPGYQPQSDMLRILYPLYDFKKDFVLKSILEK